MVVGQRMVGLLVSGTSNPTCISCFIKHNLQRILYHKGPIGEQYLLVNKFSEKEKTNLFGHVQVSLV